MTRPDLPTAALDALATYRLQRLIGRDLITEPLRNAALEALWTRSPQRSRWLEQLLDCHWCRTVWAAGIVVVLGRIPGLRLIRDLLAAAAVASLLAEHLDPEDEPYGKETR